MFRALIPALNIRMRKMVPNELASNRDPNCFAALSLIATVLLAGRPYHDASRGPFATIFNEHIDHVLQFSLPRDTPMCTRVSFNAARTHIARLYQRFSDLREPPKVMLEKPNSRLMKVLLQILATTPPTFPTLIEEAFGITMQVLKVEPRVGWPQSRDLIQALPRVFHSATLYPDTLSVYSHVMYFLLDRVKLMKEAAGWAEILQDFRVYAAKFAVSLVHCPKVSVKEMLGNVRGMQVALDFPLQDPNRIPMFLVALFSYQLLLDACRAELRRVDVGSARHGAVMERVMKVQRMVGDAISPVYAQMHAANPLHGGLRVPFQLTDQLMVNSIMTGLLLFLMGNRALFTQDIEKMRPEEQPGCEHHYIASVQAVKMRSSHEAVLRFHTQISTDLRRCLSILPYNSVVSIWDAFFERFCGDNGEEHMFDGQTFRSMVKPISLLRPLLDAVFTFVSSRLAARRDVLIVMKDFEALFAKMAQCEVDADMGGQEHVGFFRDGGQKLVNVINDYFYTANYRDAAFGLYKSVMLFTEKMLNHRSSVAGIIEPIVPLVVAQSAYIDESEAFVVKFLEFSGTLAPDCLKQHAVISFLMVAARTQYEGALPLLKTAAKQNSEAVYSNPNVVAFYETLFSILPVLAPALREIAASFLKHFPEDMVPVSLSDPCLPRTLQLENQGVCLRMKLETLVPLLVSVERIGEEWVPKILKLLSEDECWDTWHCRLAVQLFHFLLSRGTPLFEAAVQIMAWSDANIHIYSCAYCAYCSVFEVFHFDFLSKLFVVIDGKDRGREFIKSLHFLVSSRFSASRWASELMALGLIRFVRAEFLDLVPLGLFVLDAIGLIPSFDFRTEETVSFSLRMPELRRLTERQKELLAFIRDTLSVFPTALSPFLSRMEESPVFPLAIIGEMLSASRAEAEVFGWVDRWLDSWEADATTLRCLGTAFRAFPDVVPQRMEKIDGIITTLCSKGRPNQKRDASASVPFLLALVQGSYVFSSLTFDFCFEAFSPGLNPGLTLQRQQCLLGLAALAQKGDQRLTQQITAAIAERLRRVEFPREITMSTWINFSQSLDALIAFAPFSPYLYFRTIIEYLRHLAKDLGNANFPRRDVIDFNASFEALLTFLASGSCTLCRDSDRREVIAVLLGFLESCGLLRLATIRPLLLRLLKANLPEFLCVIKEHLPSCPQLLTLLLDDDDLVELLRPAVEQLTFDVTDDTTINAWRSLVAHRIGAPFPRDLVSVLWDVMKSYDSSPVSFSPTLFSRLSEVLISTDLDGFLVIALRASEQNHPLLLTKLVSIFTELIARQPVSVDVFLRLTYTKDDGANSVFFTWFVKAFVLAQPAALPAILVFVDASLSASVEASFLVELQDSEMVPSVPAGPLLARAEDDLTRFKILLYWSRAPGASDQTLVEHVNLYTQTYLPSEIRRAIEYLPQFPSNFFNLELLCGSVKQTSLHVIQANLANTKNTSPPFTLIENHLFMLEHMMNPRKLTSSVMSPAYAVSQMIPVRATDLSDEWMSIVRHLTSFLAKCWDNPARLGQDFARCHRRFAHLFGESWPACRQALQYCLTAFEEKQEVPFSQWVSYLPDFVRPMATAHVLGDASRLIATLWQIAGTSNWSQALVSLLYMAGDHEYAGTIRALGEEALGRVKELLPRLFPLFWEYFPGTAAALLPRALAGCAEDATGESDGVLRCICDRPTDSALLQLTAQMRAASVGGQRDFVRRATLCAIRRGDDKVRSAVFPFLAHPAVLRGALEGMQDRATFVAELPPELRFAAIRFLPRTVRCDGGSPPADVRLLARLLGCDLDDAAALWWSLSAQLSLCAEGSGTRLTRSPGSEPAAALAYWSDTSFAEFGDAEYTEMPPPFLMHRLGFRDRALSLLRGHIHAMGFGELRRLFTDAPSVADTAIRAVSAADFHAITDFLSGCARELTARSFTDFLVARELRLLARAAQRRPLPAPRHFPPCESASRFSDLRLLQDFLSARFQQLCLPPARLCLDEAALSAELHSGVADCRRIETELEELICAVFVGPIDGAVAPAASEALSRGLAQSGTNPVFLAAWVKEGRLAASTPAPFIAACLGIPLAWSVHFARMIAAYPEFAPLAPVLHSGFALLYVAEGITWNREAERPAVLLRRALIGGCRAAAKAFSLARTEAAAAAAIRAGQEAPPETYPPLGGPSWIAAVPLVAPLLVDPVVPCAAALFQERPDDLALQLRVRLASGELIRYVVSPVFASDARWALFADLVSDVLRRAPESFSRSQTILSVRSAPIGDGIEITLIGNKELFAQRKALRGLAAKVGTWEAESVDTVCEWFSHFGARFAALSLCQIAAESPIPNPFDLVFDGAKAAVVLGRLESPRPDRAFIRTSGRLAHFCCRQLMLGPLRTGLVAAAGAIALYRDRTTLFAEASLGWEWTEARAFIRTARKFSARHTDPEEVDRAVVELIEKSLEWQNKPFSIPWI
jgi:hypothetical protein